MNRPKTVMASNYRILLAESSRYHALLMERELCRTFPEAVITVFHNGRGTLEELHRTRYDVAVLARELDSFGALEILRQLPDSRHEQPIVVLAPAAEQSDFRQFLEAGAAHVLLREGQFHLILPRLIADVIRRSQLNHEVSRLEQMLSERGHSEIVGIVTGTLAHEINNPLMTILGVSELLLGTATQLPEDIRTKLISIEQSARRIEQSLRRLTQLEKPRLRLTDSGGLLDTREQLIRS